LPGDFVRTFVASPAPAEIWSTDPLSALHNASRALLDLLARPEVIAMYRVLIAEDRRFPMSVDYVVAGTGDAFHAVAGRLLRAAREAGQIRGDMDPELCTQALVGLLTGWSIQQALLGQLGFADTAERAAFFEATWDLFLNGVSL
jgi:hypothetical protein